MAEKTDAAESKDLLMRDVHNLRKNARGCFLFLLYWLWIDLVFQSTHVLSGAISVESLSIPAWSVPACFAIVSLVLINVDPERMARFEGTRLLLRLTCALMLAASAMVVAHEVGESFSASWSVLALVASGALFGGTLPLCIFNVGYGQGDASSNTVFLAGVVGSFAAAGAAALLGAMGLLWVNAALCLIPALIYALTVPKTQTEKRSLDELPAQRPPKSTLFVRKMAATALMHGVILGVLFSLSAPFGQIAANLSALFFAVTLATAVIIVAVYVGKFDYNTLLYRIAAVMTAAGALLVLAFPGLYAVAFVVQLAGFCLIHVLMWGLNDFLSRAFNTPLIWLVTLTTAGWFVGELVAGGLSLISLRVLGEEAGVRTMEALLALVLMLGSLLLSDSKNMADGWGFSRPVNAQLSFSGHQGAVAHIADVFQLSEKEAEVFSLFARGRNRKAIAKMLIVSEETVKSHISSIYRKTDCHSQQEIIDLLESEMAR